MTGSRRWEIDVQYFPLVVVTLPETLDEEGVRYHVTRFDALCRARKPFVLVVDTTAMREVPSPKLRKLMANIGQASADDAGRWVLGMARVVHSPLVRGVFTAITWVTTSPVPTVAVGTMKEAVDWCMRRLEDAGIELSHEVKRYRELAR